MQWACLFTIELGPHPSSINLVQYECNRCLNWFVARIKLVCCDSELAGELAGYSAVATAVAVDHHGHICRARPKRHKM